MPAQNACLGLIAVQKQQEREREGERERERGRERERERERVGYHIITMYQPASSFLSFPSFPFIALPSLAER